MPRALVVLADGFEEIEAITPIDVLRRAGVEVVTVGLTGTRVTGGHAVTLEADTTLADAPADIDVLVLPGGARGAENLREDPRVIALAERIHAAGKRVAAICATPGLVLGKSKVLAGRRATCYPGFEEHFGPDVKRSEERVVVDGALITSRGPGTALEFALTLVEQLVSKEKANELRSGMLARA